jgi:polyisoprenoid-binding protein YceI
MTSRILAALLLALPLLAATSQAAHAAAATEYSGIQTDKSSLTFVFKQMNVGIEGKFRRFSSQVAFNPAKPEGAKAEIEVDLASIDAGSAEANDEVVGKLWFNTKAYPTAKFVASSVKALGGNRYQVSGKMTIKGRSQDLSAPFTLTPQGSQAALDGAFTIKRADFAIGEGMWADFSAVANEIQIKVHLLANGAPAKK